MEVTAESFDLMAESAFNKLPEFMMDKCENIEISIENKPSGFIAERYKHVTLFGVYIAYKPKPRERNFLFCGYLPDRVILFQDNIQAKCETEEQLQTKINNVLIHEIGHHYGFSDDELSRM